MLIQGAWLYSVQQRISAMRNDVKPHTHIGGASKRGAWLGVGSPKWISAWKQQALPA